MNPKKLHKNYNRKISSESGGEISKKNQFGKFKSSAIIQ